MRIRITFNADPDTAFHLKEDLDPDPTFHFNADPDPAPHLSDANLRPLFYKTLHGSNETLKLLNFDFNSDQGPAFHSSAYPDRAFRK